MPAPKGNQFWKQRATHCGQKPCGYYESAEVLWNACQEYFDWVEANPLEEDKLVTFQGKASHEPVKKMRAMTITGLCIFLGITETTWKRHRAEDPEDVRAVVSRVEAIIRDYKFAGAAADLLNPNIIARDLGLSDKKELAGPEGGPINIKNIEYTIVDPASKDA